MAIALIDGRPARAENIDPDDDGSQYAWSENAGWINAEPVAAGAWGVQVDDFQLSGWMWSENTGWISMNCSNTASCNTTSWRVSNNGQGVLSGSAWSENAGWIVFQPSQGSGVTIDPATGEFSGEAWSENLGWIRFKGLAGRQPYSVKTAWRCNPAPAPPAGSPLLLLGKASASDVSISWNTPSGATGYDLVAGDLDRLRFTGGAFDLAVLSCVLNDSPDQSTTLPLSHLGIGAVFYLVRPVNCGGAGSWNDGTPTQTGSRDPGIAASPNACP